MGRPHQDEYEDTRAALVFLGIVLLASYALVRMLTFGPTGPCPVLRDLLVLGALALITLGVFGSLLAFLAMRPRTILMALPGLVCLVTLLAFIFVPFYRLAADVEFQSLEPERDAIVSRVLSGEIGRSTLRPGQNQTWIQLGPDEPRVSGMDNQIIVGRIDGETYVFFYAEPGFFAHYSGFLWVSDGGDPARMVDLGEPYGGVVRRYDDHWYCVSAR